MTTLYHATPRINVPAILREGLKGSRTEAYRRKGNGFVRLAIADQVATVHLSDDPLAAVSAVIGCYGLEEDDIAILEVDVADFEVHPGWDGAGTYVVTDYIEAQYVKLAKQDAVGQVRQLSMMLFEAREQIDMWADIVKVRVDHDDTYLRGLIERIDAYRAERGWPANGYGGETVSED